MYAQDLSRSLAGFMELGCYEDARNRIFQKSTKRDDLDTTVSTTYNTYSLYPALILSLIHI